MNGRIAAALAAAVLLAACSAGTTAPPDLGGGDPSAGAAAYARHCAGCHGPEGEGAVAGPPLVDEIYAPGHHADEAFLLAVRSGVRAHHWRFGPMPAMPGVTDEEVADIIAYVRGLQEAAGL